MAWKKLTDNLLVRRRHSIGHVMFIQTTGRLTDCSFNTDSFVGGNKKYFSPSHKTSVSACLHTSGSSTAVLLVAVVQNRRCMSEKKKREF